MDLFSFIKENVDILDVVGQYTSLKKTGSMYWKAKCPFHHENTPSFTVSPHKNIFYCFGCHENGDVINFIEKIEHLNAFQSAQHLAQRYNITIPEELTKAGFQNVFQTKLYYQLCHIVAQWFNSMLIKNNKALYYLKERKISTSTISQFMIGYFPHNSLEQLLSFISTHGFSSKDLLSNNIIFQGNNGLYSPFEDRIIFPIKDHLGQVCGFGGRIFLPQDKRVKYYNSMESEQFKKGKTLFGFDIAKHEIQTQKSAFLVEGYTDCIAMHQYGFKNVIATLGTACSAEQLQQLAKHAQTIFLLYDGDNAGKAAMIRLTQSCWDLDLELKVIELPINQDPASILENGNNMQEHIDKALDIFTFFLHTKSKNFAQQTMKHKFDTIQELLEIIKNIKNSLKCNILLAKAAQALQIPLDILQNEYNKIDSKSIKKELKFTEKQQPQKIIINNTDQLEFYILATIIHSPSSLNEYYETLLSTCLSEEHKNILHIIISIYKENGSVSFEDLKFKLKIEDVNSLQKLFFTIESSYIEQTLQSLMLQFQKNHWKALTSHIKMKLIQAQQEKNTTEVSRLINVFEKLKIELYKNGCL